MTKEQLDALGPALEEFLQPYLFCCGYTQTFAHLHTYCRGLLSDLKRKTVEPCRGRGSTVWQTPPHGSLRPVRFWNSYRVMPWKPRVKKRISLVSK